MGGCKQAEFIPVVLRGGWMWDGCSVEVGYFDVALCMSQRGLECF